MKNPTIMEMQIEELKEQKAELLEALHLFIHDCEDEGLDYNEDTYKQAKYSIAKIKS